MSGLTLTEKIVSLHLSRGSAPARQGDFVLIRPRRILTHDNTSAVIPKFHALFESREAAAIHDPTQPVLALDHDIQNHTPENLGRYATIERFARAHALEFHRAGSGIGHQLMLERGHVIPGSLVVASDSHANAYGAFGALGAPVVRTDAAVIWATGHTWWHIPPVINVRLINALGPGVTGKDIILSLCARFPRDAENAAVEFTGDGLHTLSISDRIAIANMTTEWGAIACIMEPDDAVDSTLAARGLHPHTWADAPRRADRDARYAHTIDLDLSSIEPTITGPNRTDLTTSARALAAQRIPIDAAYLLSCVNARLPDLEAAALILCNRRIQPRVRFYIAAASAEIQRDAEAHGIWQTLLASGATPLPSGCGPCIGLGEGTLKPGETAISATNRNFPGRMGDRSAQVYLASPAVVAASALAGYITTPALLDDAETNHHRGTERREKQTDPRERAVPEDMTRSRRDVSRVPPVPAEHREAELVSQSTASTPHSPLPLAPAPTLWPSVALRGELLPSPAFQPSVPSSLRPPAPSSTPTRTILIPEPDISTDAIYAGRHTYRSDMTPAEMAAVIFENLDPTDTPPITPHISRADIILAGRNFGRGSSREQAATALKHAGIAAVIAVSINATYLRNAINNGVLALECPDLEQILPLLLNPASPTHPRLGRSATLDLDASTLTLHTAPADEPASRIMLALRPLAPFMRSLLASGGVELWARATLHNTHATAARSGPITSSAQTSPTNLPVPSMFAVRSSL
ncbi:MAG: hypothetical protein KF912_14435 [Phycisphaeraceae bacterium]|nr:hypothetical protein [Phycisphaeraceae bacterium]MBX3368502.1 hypothetical protein [Phycisphaeraceae bacterium]